MLKLVKKSLNNWDTRKIVYYCTLLYLESLKLSKLTWHLKHSHITIMVINLVNGYLPQKNDTDDGVYTVYTGATDLMKLGVIDKYNGTR